MQVEALPRDHSLRDAAVIDPIAGSGSTLIACHRLARLGFLMEIESRYSEVIRGRWRCFTGRQEARSGRHQVA